MMDEYGIRYLRFDGKTPPTTREKILIKFRDDPDIRVLIISQVGSTGLNIRNFG